MTYSLDTNVLISLIRDRAGARSRFERARASTALVVSSVVHYELLVGAYGSSRMEDQLRLVRRLMERTSVVEFNEADAVQAAHLGAALHAQGQDIGAFDTLIAGQALNRGWTVVTANTKHFNRVPGLDVVDWSALWTPSHDA